MINVFQRDGVYLDSCQKKKTKEEECAADHVVDGQLSNKHN